MAKKRKLLILLLIVLSVSLAGCSQDGGEEEPSDGTGLSAEEAKSKTIDYINDNLVMANTTATAVSVEDKGSVYEVMTQYRGNEVPLYISKDGEQLFLKAFNLSSEETAGQTQELSAEEAEAKTIDYVNNNLVMPGSNASAVSVEEKPYVYEVLTEYQGQQQPIHISKDGRYLLLGALNTSEELPQPTPTATVTATASPYTTEQLEEFVACLNQSGMTIYGAEWCGHCQDLVNTLGGHDIVNPIYIECTENKQLCQNKGIEAYPTITINGTKYTGSRTIQALSQTTGCPTPE